MPTLTDTDFIDQDVDPDNTDNAYMLTTTSLWKTSALTGAVSWSEILTYDQFSDLDGVTFLRVRARSGYVYVLGKGNPITGSSDVIVFYSYDSGTSWSYSVVEENAISEYPSLEIDSYGHSGWDSPGSYISANVIGNIIVIEEGVVCATGGCQAFPNVKRWVNIKIDPPAPEPAGTYPTIEFDIGGRCPSQGYDDDGDAYPWCTLFMESTWAGVYGDPLTTHASGTLDTRYVQEVLGFGNPWGHEGRWSACPPEPCDDAIKKANFYITNIEIAGLPYGAKDPKAFDIGRHDPRVVYVGTSLKIWTSLDGAQNWDVYTDEIGARDIECHYAQGDADGEITFWDSDGYIRRSSGGIGGGVVLGDAADVSYTDTPLRVASDTVNAWPIYILEHQGAQNYTLKKTDNGVTWDSVEEDIELAKSLKTYAVSSSFDRRIVYLKNDGIMYSEDGENFENKNTNYNSWGFPVVINLF